jgi:hypothetical protein
MAAFGSGSPRRFQRLAMTCFVGKTSLRGERSPTKQSSAAGAKNGRDPHRRVRNS